MPADLAARLMTRDRQILADRDNGMSLAEIARRHQMTERGVRTLLQRLERADTSI